MSSYNGRHAELYDLFYADKPYAEEALFIHECIKRYSVGSTNRLLELACGTGSHAFELEKLGYEIVAIDSSEDMLAVANRKALQMSSSVNFHSQDMTKLQLGERDFDCVLCLFDSIGYVATNKKIRAVLETVYSHLRPDGLFIFEFWHAGAMLRSYEPLRLRRWQVEHGEILRISDTKIDYVNQLCHVTYDVLELDRNGTFSQLTETQTNRYFLIQEMSEWLTASGFTPLKSFAGFRDDEDINQDTWHVVTVARRN